jgi:hypothetical protein
MPPICTKAASVPQRLEKAGYAARGADPDDRPAQLIQLTPSGTAAAGRIREVGRSGMQAALAHWSPDTLHQFATLFNRMVDDFLAYDAGRTRGLISAGERSVTVRCLRRGVVRV